MWKICNKMLSNKTYAGGSLPNSFILPPPPQGEIIYICFVFPHAITLPRRCVRLHSVCCVERSWAMACPFFNSWCVFAHMTHHPTCYHITQHCLASYPAGVYPWVTREVYNPCVVAENHSKKSQCVFLFILQPKGFQSGLPPAWYINREY